MIRMACNKRRKSRLLIQQYLAALGVNEEAALDRQLEISHQTSNFIIKMRKLT